jgi:hypothetical protein
VKQRDWLERFGGGSFHAPALLLQLMWESFQASEVTWLGGDGFACGAPFPLGALPPWIARHDRILGVTDFAVPAFEQLAMPRRSLPSGIPHVRQFGRAIAKSYRNR